MSFEDNASNYLLSVSLELVTVAHTKVHICVICKLLNIPNNVKDFMQYKLLACLYQMWMSALLLMIVILRTSWLDFQRSFAPAYHPPYILHLLQLPYSKSNLPIKPYKICLHTTSSTASKPILNLISKINS